MMSYCARRLTLWDFWDGRISLSSYNAQFYYSFCIWIHKKMTHCLSKNAFTHMYLLAYYYKYICISYLWRDFRHNALLGNPFFCTSWTWYFKRYFVSSNHMTLPHNSHSRKSVSLWYLDECWRYYIMSSSTHSYRNPDDCSLYHVYTKILKQSQCRVFT